MPDQYTEVTSKSWGSRIMDSIKGIVFGLALFIGAFVLLYWNEGRIDKSLIADTATPMDATESAPADLEGKLVAASGKLTSAELISDGLYLASGPYVAVDRRVEMYAWVEEQKSESNVKTGGSEETTVTYNYKKDWVNTPQDSSKFKVPTGHENPTKVVNDNRSYASSAKVGLFSVDVRTMQLPEFAPIALDNMNTKLSNGAALSGTEHVYRGTGTFENPTVGDIRIKYAALLPETDSVAFGKLTGQKIITYTDKEKDVTLYRLFSGGDKDSAVAQMASEHNTLMWILRVLGFLMMWIGLASVFGPLSTVLDVLPIFGQVTRSAVSGLSFLVALVLSAVTILISMILHNLIAIIIAGVVVVGIFVLWMLKKKKKA